MEDELSRLRIDFVDCLGSIRHSVVHTNGAPLSFMFRRLDTYRAIPELLKKERQSLETTTSLCINRVEGLRSKTATLELEITILKSQRSADHARIGDLQRDVAILQESSHNLSGRLRQMSESMERLQVLNEHIKETYADMTSPDLSSSYVEFHVRTLASELNNSGK